MIWAYCRVAEGEKGELMLLWAWCRVAEGEKAS